MCLNARTMNQITYQKYIGLTESENSLFYINSEIEFPSVVGNSYFGQTSLWDGEKFLDCAQMVHRDGSRSYALKDTSENRAKLAKCQVGSLYRIL